LTSGRKICNVFHACRDGSLASGAHIGAERGLRVMDVGVDPLRIPLRGDFRDENHV
jgi:hypothetical protein